LLSALCKRRENRLDAGHPATYYLLMAAKVDELIQGALDLPVDQRISLAHKILASIEPPPTSEIESAWDEEIKRRIGQYDAGQSKGIPAEEVFGEVERRLKK